MKYDDADLRSRGWNDHDKLIICHRWKPMARGEIAECELCREKVSAWPASIGTAREDKEFHIVCRECAAIAAAANDFNQAGYATQRGIEPWN